MAKLFNPLFQAVDGNGNPLAGAKLNFYTTGTTSRRNTYSNADLDPSHVNTNPVIADSNGRWGPIYLDTDQDYKVILTDASGVTVSNGTVDPLLYISSDSVIGHQGSLIVGNANGAESELLLDPNADSALRSNGTTAEWRRANFTKQVFLSGSGTYTTPANCTALRVRVQAGGGGGGGVGLTTGPNGAAGSNSSFNGIAASGGGGGIGNTSGSLAALGAIGGAGGTGGSGTASFRIPGGDGGNLALSGFARANGGGSAMGPGAPVTYTAAANGTAAKANTGGGGGGASAAGSVEAASSGGGGEYLELHIIHPSATYAYVVGGGGAGGIGTGTGAQTGGAGGSGIVIVEEYYW